MTITLRPLAAGSDWLPETAQLYLAHVVEGRSIRALARETGCHPSTILRRVRAYENRRDDPLVDEALEAFSGGAAADPSARSKICKDNDTRREGTLQMSAPIRSLRPDAADLGTVEREARRILRRLSEVGAVLAVAPDMDKAAVLKGTNRIAVVDRAIAQAFAVNDWIAVQKAGRVTLYDITAAGRSALKRMLAEDQEVRGSGFAEAQDAFGAQHRFWGERHVMETGEDGPKRMRYNLAESPLTALARRRDKDGTAFLGADLIAAGERLREDFELAQLGPRVAQNWDRFLTGAERGGFAVSGDAGGSSKARDRVAAALRDLGLGLGDVALRCCCYLEGLEAAERRMGWSARSGKIVLRIALQRLKLHYEETHGGMSPMIG